ncbi:hypothetical protein MGAST_06220 [Mycobacterium gastri 'Wayne']|nr:hypothetical protein MGAST_06220 [Mycobacterium gastri 'Wayne']
MGCNSIELEPRFDVDTAEKLIYEVAERSELAVDEIALKLCLFAAC